MKKIAIAVALVLLAACGSIVMKAGAQDYSGPAANQTVAMHWHGDVDDTVNVYFRADQSWTKVISGRGIDNQRFRVWQPLPQGPVHACITNVQGRGSIQVIQQPHEDNDFTAIVQIDDPQPGRGVYSFDLGWS